MLKILVLNGPNLDMLGVREPALYGNDTLHDLELKVQTYGRKHNVDVVCVQSNSEAELILKIHEARNGYDGIIYNPGAHAHYSYALRDALGGIEVPCVEVHISSIDTREAFRRKSVIAPVCVALIKGRGFQGYCDALDLLLSGAHERLGEDYERRYPIGDMIVGGRSEYSDGSGMLSEKDMPAGEVLSTRAATGGFLQAGSSAYRLGRLRDACVRDNLQAFFVRDTSNIAWLTGFDNVFDSESAHALLVDRRKAVLHTDSRYSEAARLAAAVEHAVEIDDTAVSHAAFAVRMLAGKNDSSLGNSKKENTFCGNNLGIEDSMSLAHFRALESAFSVGVQPVCLRETDGFVSALRSVKEPLEIARMKAAQAITDAAFTHIAEFIRPGLTEREVQIELEYFMRCHGAEGLAFTSIVATGENGANPHAVASSARLEAGQCVVLDFGAKAYGYCSDMTRTVFLGEPSAQMRLAYEAIRQANEQTEAMLKPGITGRQAHELAERVLADFGFAGKMGHGLGHGVGLDVHEEPVLAPRNRKPLVTGNVVTVEPGIYLSGEFGMRLEDFGVITDGGFEVFTQSSHDMMIR